MVKQHACNCHVTAAKLPTPTLSRSTPASTMGQCGSRTSEAVHNLTSSKQPAGRNEATLQSCAASSVELDQAKSAAQVDTAASQK